MAVDDIQVFLTPIFRRYDGDFNVTMRPFFPTYQMPEPAEADFIKRGVHQIMVVDDTGEEVSSGFPNARIRQMVVKNHSATEKIELELRFWQLRFEQNSKITIPPGRIVSLPDIDYATFQPTVKCSTAGATAKCEVWFWCTEESVPVADEFLEILPGECTYVPEPWI